MTTPASTAPTILSVRLSPTERAILGEAADQARTSLSDFVRRKAIAAAEDEILNRSNVIIPAEHWEAFEAWVNGPPKVIPALVELARRKPAWEK